MFIDSNKNNKIHTINSNFIDSNKNQINLIDSSKINLIDSYTLDSNQIEILD